MNSVTRHLNAESKAATLIVMRSARKEVLLVVEGDTDVDLFANVLSIPRSNILSCNGKETLMLVYEMAPQKGIDSGTVFIRDRDNDDIATSVNNGVIIGVTKLYDIEMDLLNIRLFGRILSEFTRKQLDPTQVSLEFAKLCRAASVTGAIRLYSKNNDTGLDFDDIKYNRFLDAKEMSVKIDDAVRYIFAKSKKKIIDYRSLENSINDIISSRNPVDIVCSKDLIEIMHIALSRHYSACAAGECLPSTISRIIRISAVHDDLKAMSMYFPLRAHIEECGFPWRGAPL